MLVTRYRKMYRYYIIIFLVDGELVSKEKQERWKNTEYPKLLFKYQKVMDG